MTAGAGNSAARSPISDRTAAISGAHSNPTNQQTNSHGGDDDDADDDDSHIGRPNDRLTAPVPPIYAQAAAGPSSKSTQCPSVHATANFSIIFERPRRRRRYMLRSRRTHTRTTDAAPRVRSLYIKFSSVFAEWALTAAFAPVLTLPQPTGGRQLQRKVVQIRAHDHLYQPDTKSNPNPIHNPNPTTKQQAVLSIQRRSVTCPTYPEKFTRDNVIAPFSVLAVVVVTLP